METTTDHSGATATGREAASTQAVKRGFKVSMVEVPDAEDDTSFRKWEATNKKSPIAPEVTQPTVAESSDSGAKAEKVPHEWLKPFEAEWTLRGIKEAKTESEARAVLKNWIARGWAEEVVDKMTEGLWKAMRINVLWQMEEL